MALIKSTAIPSGATDYELEQSLRFNDDDSPYLTFQPSSASNRKTYTFSFWFKRATQTNESPIFTTNQGHEPGFNILFGGHLADDFELNIYDYTSGSANIHLRTTQKFRDSSAWYHIVVAVDTTQGTAANRAKIYVNGNQITDFATETYPSQNSDTNMNNPAQQSGKTWSIGSSTERSQYADGYLSEFNCIDGQALTPSSFGETGTYGEWKPIEYSGTYGTNGFYLPFKQDYTVEGFSTVTYKGTGASQYVGGTGFKPDFTWIKMRDGTDEHRIMDSVRGIPFSSKTTTAAEDNDEVTGFTSRSTDGFSVGSAGPYNNSSNKFVAWNWDMGADTPTGFGAVTYKGGASNVSGFGFSPDLVWIKSRGSTHEHILFDTIRGATKNLTSVTTAAEWTNTGGLTAFEPDGFKLGTWNDVNSSSYEYVSWGWDMGNTTATNTSGSISSQVRVNPTYGQSIVTWSGSSSTATVGHGLSSAPEMIIVKRRDASTNWPVWHTSVSAGTDDFINGLNSTSGTITSEPTFFTSTDPTNAVFSVGSSSQTNAGNMVAYAFHSVSGYSKIGNYSGTGSTGNSVTTGFRPAFLLIKRDADEGWQIIDSTRNPLNTATTSLSPNSSAAERNDLVDVDFTSTGFTLQNTDGSINASGSTYLYYAVAGGMDSISDYNTDGSIDSRVKASTTYGQSIVSYTGSGTTGTVGHGLSSAPEMYVVKNRDAADDWAVYHTSLGNAKRLSLNDPNAEQSTNNWNSTSPTSDAFTVYGGENRVNDNNEKYIAYCWHSVTGYSTIGSFTGNGDSRSTPITISCGFKPAFIIMKVADASSNRDWYIWDDTRSNPPSKHLRPNIANAEAGEAGKIEFTSTGVNITTNDDELNANGKKTIYMVFADKREYAYWLDQSGNNNDWTSNNLTESDISVDSPTNNFCTWNPLSNEITANATLAEGNLKGTTGQDYNGTGSTMNIFDNGKTYIEFTPTAIANDYYVGILASEEIGTQQKLYNGGPCYVYRTDGLLIYNPTNNPADEANVSTDVNTFGVGDIGQLAIDTTANKIWIGKNNVWQMSGTQNPSTGTGGYTIASHAAGYTVVFGTGSNDSSNTGVVNFGQDSSFSGNKTAQGNQDGNEIGDFYYTPPTGFLALCTSNLPDVAVTPSEHFNTVLYTGTGSSNAISVGFQPDLVWLKMRTQAYDHNVYDSVRGATKYLYTNATDSEATNAERLKTFDSNGFTVGTQHAVNENTYPFVAWNWKANGSGSSNTNGSINSTVSANVDAGFSIVNWTKEGSSGTKTVGHGLSKAPEIIIFKEVDDPSHWSTYVGVGGSTTRGLLYLNLNDAQTTNDANQWSDTAPTSTVFTYNQSYTFGANNTAEMIGYAFHSVDGYSKMGSYTGNGSTDGTFVYTGFKPMMVIYKRSSASEDWYIRDTARDPTNPGGNALSPNSTGTTSNNCGSSGNTCIDYLSNGFKLRGTDTQSNDNGSTYIYIAFASVPFKFSNAR